MQIAEMSGLLLCFHCHNINHIVLGAFGDAIKGFRRGGGGVVHDNNNNNNNTTSHHINQHQGTNLILIAAAQVWVEWVKWAN